MDLVEEQGKDIKGDKLKLKIVLDATVLVKGRKHGVARFVINSLNMISQSEDNNEYYVFIRSDYPLAELPKSSKLHYRRIKIINNIIWTSGQLPFELIRINPDIVHHFVENGPLWGKSKLVVTAHEWPGFRAHSEIKKSKYEKISKLYGKIVIPFILRRATKIIADSQFTKKSFLEHYKINKSKIRVIYGAQDTIFRRLPKEELNEIRIKYGLSNLTIMHITTSDPRDNNNFVLRLIARLKLQFKRDFKLVIVGKILPPELNSLYNTSKKLGIQENLVFTGYVSDEELLRLYNIADVYIHPSMYEGFGLGLAEAMACGTPVIAFKNTSIPEVLGEAGILMETNNINSFSKALEHLLLNNALRTKLGNKGIKRAKKFTWEKYLEEVLNIYERINDMKHLKHDKK